MKSCGKDENYAVFLENEIAEEGHIHSDLELIYVIEGTLEVCMDDRAFTLGPEDVLLVNGFVRHSIHGPVLDAAHDGGAARSGMADDAAFGGGSAGSGTAGDPASGAVFGRIFFERNWFFKTAGTSGGYYRCIARQNADEKYEKLREYLRDVLREALQKHSSAFFLDGYVSLAAGYIHESFCVSAPVWAQENGDHEIRDEMILDYLESHYSEPITLNELADYVHLSRTYLSRYFRRTFKMTLMEYLSELRLKYAVGDVLHTDKTVLQIAVDHGFASPSAFNRRFMERFGMTPSAYRKAYRSALTPENSAAAPERLSEAPQSDTFAPPALAGERVFLTAPSREFLAGYLRPKEAAGGELRLDFSGDALCAVPFAGPWNHMINGGALQDMLASRLQNHLITLHNHLRFTYVRLWNIFARQADKAQRFGAPGSHSDGTANAYGHGAPGSHSDGTANVYGHGAADVYRYDAPDSYNFDGFDSVVDFLLEHGMKPFIDLGTKVSAVRRNTTDMLEKSARVPAYPPLEQFEAEVRALLLHLAGRYGTQEVSQWRFELWNPWGNARLHDSYAHIFERIFRLIKSYFPESFVGGSGMHLNENSLPDLKLCAQMPVQPDFLSFYYFPYDEKGFHLEKGAVFTRDTDDFEHQLSRMSKAMEAEGLENIPLYITEWSMSVSDRNFFNDSCLKGAYMIKNMIAAVGKAPMAAYWSASDLTSDYYDFVHLLGGGHGLLTKDGIAKPAYYAFEFLGKLGPLLIGKNENAIVTANGLDSFYIVCHNHKAFNYKYYLRDESTIPIDDLEDYLADKAPLKLHFHVDHIKNGTYLYRKSRVTADRGSVIYEWSQYGFMDNLRREDIQHLRNSCTPQIVSRRFQVGHGCLELDVELEANEIAYIHIYPE